VVERWLRVGERQNSRVSLEQELERYYSQPAGQDEAALAAALGSASREIASRGERRRPGRRVSR
jgi:hypothetical protein